MEKYFYKDGTEVKENDIIFYSEDDGEHNWHYADQIGVIVKDEDDFKTKAYVITMDGASSFIDYIEPKENMVSLKYDCLNYYSWNKDKPSVLEHTTKIGEYPKDEHMLTSEYAINNYKQN